MCTCYSVKIKIHYKNVFPKKILQSNIGYSLLKAFVRYNYSYLISQSSALSKGTKQKKSEIQLKKRICASSFF